MLTLIATKTDKGNIGAFSFVLIFFGAFSLLVGLLPGIDNAAHIGGLIIGFITGLIMIYVNEDTFIKEKT